MTRDQLENHLHALLTSAAHDFPHSPRPQGTFVANSPRAGLSGMRVVTPDGTTFYLAVLGIDAFEDEEPGAGPGPGTNALRAAAMALLDARDAEMLTEEEWEGLARAVDPPALLPEGAIHRFVYDPAEGLVRVVEAGGKTLLRQSAIPDALAAVAEFAQSRTEPFFIEGARQAEGFQFGRNDVEAACEFMVHLGLLAREADGSYSAHGEDIADKALAAMNALPQA
ncbi:MAG: hypothetical protein HBSAPP03_23370 [Phycisphaerae bacterium]|nr:MAG: hypothetical protein HBSAPP03_23370 [Phycisphaerae bacterium]